MTLIDTTVVPFSPPVNLRDLGGIRTDGGPVRRGFAVRSDDLAIASPASIDALVAAGLTTVVDLRSSDEVALTGRGPLGAHGTVTYHHVPFLASIGDAADESADAAARPRTNPLAQPTFERMYLRMFEGAAPHIVTALAVIAHAPGTVAFHCAAGQDRTGVLAAALLLAIGAKPDDIVEDYARTGVNSSAIMQRIAPVMTPLLAAHGLELDEAARAAARAEFSPAPMRGLLTRLAERHGDPLAPLRRAGLTPGLTDRLRERAGVA